MKKKIAVIMILIIGILSVTFTFASCYRPNKDLFELDGTTIVRLTNYGRSQSHIVVPDGITGIGNDAFKNCINLIKVELPDSVESIGEGAFEFCYGLREINIPYKVTQIKSCAFGGCMNLTKINIPDSVTEIGYLAFAMCTSLTNIVIPNGVEAIDYFAFGECYNLVIYYEGKTMPDGWKDGGKLTIFEESDFVHKEFVPIVYDCKNNDVADDGCIYTVAENGVQYAIKDGVAKVSGHAYLDDELVISERITYNEASYPVTKIDDMSFYFSNIKNLSIPDSVKEIGYGAFGYCHNLESVYLSISVEKIGYGAFIDCNNLKIYCEAQEQPDGWDRQWNPDALPVMWSYKIK